MSVPRGTTPTFTLTFEEENLDLTQAHNVYVTFTSGKNTLTKTGNSLVVSEKSIDVYLKQIETLKFEEDIVRIQVNWTTGRGDRAASEVVDYDMSEQLLRKVIA